MIRTEISSQRLRGLSRGARRCASQPLEDGPEGRRVDRAAGEVEHEALDAVRKECDLLDRWPWLENKDFAGVPLCEEVCYIRVFSVLGPHDPLVFPRLLPRHDDGAVPDLYVDGR